MALSSKLKITVNRVLQPLGVEISSLLKKRALESHTHALKQAGHFDQPVFPVPDSIVRADVGPVVDAWRDHRDSCERLMSPASNEVGYVHGNSFFSGSDAYVLYLMIRALSPATFFEIGSGHSTKIARQAAIDAGSSTRIVSIDPQPRADIDDLADDVRRCRLEELAPADIVAEIGANGILFIDSSHTISIGNDVVTLFLQVMPKLAKGIVIHVHDIFLPFEYPKEWGQWGWDWNEQYLVQVLLTSERYKVLWPGHYLHKLRPELRGKLPFLASSPSQSMWLQVEKNIDSLGE